MDREQEEMQFLGLFDIYIEAYKIIYRWRKLFSQITLSLILPWSFIFLAHVEVYHLLFSDLKHSEFQLHHTHTNTARYKKISDHITSELVSLCIFNVAYLTITTIFSLLSTSAVVYTIACIYSSREVNFTRVMSVVPKVWKRVMVTFLFAFLCIFIYHVVAGFAIAIWVVFAVTVGEDHLLGPFAFVIMAIIYGVGLVYLTVIWNLASVVTVLEDSYGVKAMIKSKELIKGKWTIALVFFFKFNLSLGALNFIFKKFVVLGNGKHMHLGMFYRIGFGLLCLLLMFMLMLFVLVIQTIIYFVCKSYHHENIDKSALSDHLEVYLGEYEPLKSKDVQMEDYQV